MRVCLLRIATAVCLVSSFHVNCSHALTASLSVLSIKATETDLFNI